MLYPCRQELFNKINQLPTCYEVVNSKLKGGSGKVSA